MEIKTYNFDGLPIAVIDNFYAKNECENIMQELLFLNNYASEKLLPPEETGSATNLETNKILKKNKGIFLDFTYSKREFSNILKENRKLFDYDFRKKLQKEHTFFNYLSTVNSDYTLMQYYENEDFYEDHCDYAVITAISWFYKKPKNFIGGNLNFSNELKLSPDYNRLVIFPSFMKHSVDKICVEDIGKNNGRFSISQFLKFK